MPTTSSHPPGKETLNPQRVVSLLGAATETLFRLGLGSTLVGRSHECDYPPAVLSLPCISRPRLDVDAPSLEIDASVRTLSAAGEPVYKLDGEVLSGLSPDLIIAQDHCRVCAVTPDDLAGSEACLNVDMLVVRPSTLSDCMGCITEIAEAMGYPERGAALRATLEGRMDRIREVVADVAVPSERPRVALLEWCDPIMGCGYWLPELVDVAGGDTLHCPPPGGATPTLSFRALLDSDPDVVIFALCGFGLTRAAAEIRDSWGKEKLEQLGGVCDGRMFVVDGNYLINRSGPRVVESAEALAEAIHPALRGHFGHFGTELLMTMDQAMTMANAGEKTGSAKVRPQSFPEDDVAAGNVTTAKEKIHPVLNPEDAVQAQLLCLRTGDMRQAFALNSVANQVRWCAKERFEAVLKSHGDFKRLLLELASIKRVQETDEGVATVHVSLPECDGMPMVGLIWTMVAEWQVVTKEMAWRTEKVAIAH